ncbi:uncharacterized protein LOC119466800 isoform X2 [Cebus imitator]|uniref:uncharacterized protein LOC119466800 isoform X2 n=1 Tax=Cebus imitator TaxID=2715852 RepID=UPI0018987841|nr:uncharacterized protein LOC119466800 isoform X2 [Cebus imitator]
MCISFAQSIRSHPDSTLSLSNGDPGAQAEGLAFCASSLRLRKNAHSQRSQPQTPAWQKSVTPPTCQIQSSVIWRLQVGTGALRPWCLGALEIVPHSPESQENLPFLRLHAPVIAQQTQFFTNIALYGFPPKHSRKYHVLSSQMLLSIIWICVCYSDYVPFADSC